MLTIFIFAASHNTILDVPHANMYFPDKPWRRDAIMISCPVLAQVSNPKASSV